MKNKLKCEICDKICNNITHLSTHIRIYHKEIDNKNYYDTYFKIEGEDNCKNQKCSNKVKFNSLGRGYKNNNREVKFCSISCARSDNQTHEKQRRTCIEKYGDSNFRNPEKNKLTCIDRYGVENVLCKGTKFYNKRNQIVKSKYGVENIFQAEFVKERIRKTMKESGVWIDYQDDKFENYKEYYRIAWNYYKSIRNEFLDVWNGYDFYDGEYIKENFSKDSNDGDYPSIDHIISIKDCFLKGISPIEASNFNNLCVTKRRINAAKKNFTLEHFLQIKNPT